MHRPASSDVKSLRGIVDEYAEWVHPDCKEKHGVLRHVPPQRIPAVESALTVLYGPRSSRRRFNDGMGGDYDVEFMDTNAFYPAPRKPWEYCGTSILFEDEHQRDLELQQAVREFKPGDQVRFMHRGKSLVGLIARVNKKRCTVVVKHDGAYYVPGKDMAIEND